MIPGIAQAESKRHVGLEVAARAEGENGYVTLHDSTGWRLIGASKMQVKDAFSLTFLGSLLHSAAAHDGEPLFRHWLRAQEGVHGHGRVMLRRRKSRGSDRIKLRVNVVWIRAFGTVPASHGRCVGEGMFAHGSSSDGAIRWRPRKAKI